MVWQIKISKTAEKQISKLDKIIQKRLIKFFKKLAASQPRKSGKALQGSKGELWRYRVGDYRIISTIKDSELIVLVIAVGHRKNIYKQA